ncbi:maleylpyruvate isomerase family mycothiol-dependent enzyme [Nocardioides mesophilus]|uniref:Maleylpyruvate isomerase family mycothiol-dependent enzyme n=1 Tax=Nocardioides mesophilus TaxID=433659 RepID=A0A7G9RE59_9ACTN|nr:maleylpyruvate isomerase family mycothiol-dependent enzyme [Nocardioides mesophilus]QNN53884.1 maleylpyruvate isomerase family mycothiol-dependent enzyme [Nocardioides mesophilus]
MTSHGIPGLRGGLDLVERFVDVAERFTAGIAVADLHAPVAGCPGWTTYDLAVHLGNVHAWAATVVETGRSAPGQNDEPRVRRSRAVSDWYAGKAEDLYQVLRAADPQRPCWNFAFGDDGLTSFWQRRQLHETTVHVMDLDAATGVVTPVSPLLAEDGVDEVLTVFLHRMHRRGHPTALTAPLSLVTTDTGRAWTLTPRTTHAVPSDTAGAPMPSQPGSRDQAGPAVLVEGPPMVVGRRHPQADTLSAPAENLYRVLWKRAPVAEVSCSGDRSRIDAFLGSRLVP